VSILQVLVNLFFLLFPNFLSHFLDNVSKSAKFKLTLFSKFWTLKDANYLFSRSFSNYPGLQKARKQCRCSRDYFLTIEVHNTIWQVSFLGKRKKIAPTNFSKFFFLSDCQIFEFVGG
tara:strand:+ start:140 stop:493 length:354 start_codon:yes stop_codon:yes gene_type:complete